MAFLTIADILGQGAEVEHSGLTQCFFVAAYAVGGQSRLNRTINAPFEKLF